MGSSASSRESAHDLLQIMPKGLSDSRRRNGSYESLTSPSGMMKKSASSRLLGDDDSLRHSQSSRKTTDTGRRGGHRHGSYGSLLSPPAMRKAASSRQLGRAVPTLIDIDDNFKMPSRPLGMREALKKTPSSRQVVVSDVPTSTDEEGGGVKHVQRRTSTRPRRMRKAKSLRHVGVDA